MEDVLLKEELDKLIDIGKENGGLRTTTIIHLLNDLGRNEDENYRQVLEYIEDKKIVLIVDNFAEKNLILDSSKIAILPKTLSVESIIKKIQYEEINLDTDFQRKRSLWSDSVKSQLIESLMIQLPIPPMYFDGHDPNRWQVIDGLQRLCTLKEFLIDKKWKLKDLEYLPDYNNCSMEDLPRIYQRRIEEGQMAFYLILPETPEDVKYSLFKRINTPGLTLEPQEIRHALYQGKATRLLQELAENDTFVKATDGDISSKRMQDREIVLRYLALRYLGVEVYKEGNVDNYLNKAMKFINDQTDEFIDECKKTYFSALECMFSVFGKYAFRRISKIRPSDKKPFNTALFESWMNGVSLLNGKEQERLIKNKEQLKELYIEELDKKSSFYNDIGSGKYRSLIRRNETIKKMIQEVLDAD
ncbi:MAG TPA: DUF262 domain-containing protein [Candidatus Caccovicinus merdipullorum]|uniref:DUF262 domain-containing protein n=1 Tax=Candidatus Caccovicinus merdipullorum TaxID=2840724 RepID=A0A9D1GIT9_9FIRM|nr:DUF262 domain-containing protein [Candidatus Caccovicinus merdipullorum]